MVSKKGVAQAIMDLSEHLPNQYELNHYLRYFATSILFPFAVACVVLGIVFQLLALLHRHWYPLTAAQLHRQAIVCWRQDDLKAVQLLEESLRRDPWYERSWLSLIAIHLYHQQNIPAAKTRYQQAVQYFSNSTLTTTTATNNTSNNTTTTNSATTLSKRGNSNMTKALQRFQLDIMAFEQNSGCMVQTGAFVEDYLQVEGIPSLWQPMVMEPSSKPSSPYARHLDQVQKALKVE